MQRRKPSLFANDLATAIWSKRDLVNRAMSLTKPIKNLPGRSPVKVVEKSKQRLYISIVIFHNKKVWMFLVHLSFS